MKRHRGLLVAAGIWMLSWFVMGEVPGVIHHQGRLLINGTNHSGIVSFKFALVSATGDATYWSHDGTSIGGSEPTGLPISLMVTRAIFSVGLGDSSISNMTHAIPASAFLNSEVCLRIWVDDGIHGWQRLSPDRKIGAVGYALVAGRLLEPVDHARTAETLTGQLSGDVTGTQSATVVRWVGEAPANHVAATVADVARASRDNIPATLVRRDNAGNFVAGTVTGNFVGNGSGLTSLNAAQLSGSIAPALLESSMPSGFTVVSVLPDDPSLLSRGYSRMLSVPSPPWSNGSAVDAPSARTGHSAIWDGQRMLVWGGVIGSGLQYVDTGGIYHPESDEWTPLSTLGAPEPRAAHGTVWTGAEMLVWGGNGQSDFLGTGGRFNPISQSWAPISTNNAPTSRSGHVAIWTGKRMLIWGGQNDSGLLNDGALYDPASDQWTDLNLPGTPEARVGATAVWTGDRAILWGGQGAGGALNTGGQLLLTDAIVEMKWISIPTLNAPSARHFHSAVWTGENMLIWGGERGGEALGDGAAFDLLADAWKTIPSAEAPVARSRHSALWTGQEMLILGGSSQTASGATSFAKAMEGRGFDVLSGRWRALSRLGNPQPRMDGGFIWTGTEIVTFGGSADGQPISALQRLIPQPVWYFYRKL